MNWEYVLVGFIVGACTAYSGVGAGAITTPALIFLGVTTSKAIGSDLLFALGTGIVAVAAHVQKRTVELPVLLRLAIGGFPAAIIGVAISAQLHRMFDIHQVEHILRLAIAGALIVSAGGVVFSRSLGRDHSNESETALPTLRLVAIGFFVGLTVSITSIGAGSLLLPLLILAAPVVALRRLVGTGLAFAVVVFVPSLIGHWQLGDVNASIAGSLLLGSIPGVVVGSRFGTHLPERWFRGALAGVLVVVALALSLPVHHA